MLTNTLCHKIVHAACKVVSYLYMWVSAFYMPMLDERATAVLWNFMILRLILLDFVSNGVCVCFSVLCKLNDCLSTIPRPTLTRIQHSA